jgi:HEXXH motif-containing protein
VPLQITRVNLPLSVIEGLSAGRDLADIVPRLNGTERSRRLQLINHVLRVSDRVPGLGPIDSLAPAQELFARAQRADPAAVEDVLAYPQTGLWVTHLVRRLSGVLDDEIPLWVHLGHYNALAAAAAITAGVDFDIEVPTRDGVAHLPTVGSARFTGIAQWAPARVTGAGEVLSLAAAGEQIRLPRPHRSTPPRTSTSAPTSAPTQEVPGWRSVTYLRPGREGRALSVTLDVLDPYPACAGLEPAPGLSEAEVRAWSKLLIDAWQLLARDHVEEAAGLAAGLRSIIPLPSGPGVNGRSGSSSDAFGAAALSLPTDATALAMTLVHEFRHSLLNGLLHLVPLCDQSDARPLYAPWRDDPRPIIGLLHGAFAFTGVTDFWRTRLRKDTGTDWELACFEFALRRQQATEVLDGMRSSASLTEVGGILVHNLWQHSKGWNDDPVPARPARLAELSAASHRAAWRAAQVEVDPQWARRSADRWTHGLPAEPLPRRDDVVRADPAARHLDRLSTLSRHRLAGRSGPVPGFAAGQALGSTAGQALGSAAGQALVDGDQDRARRLYLRALAAEPESVPSWGGLAVTMIDHSDRIAARTLIERPECVRAVYREAAAGTILAEGAVVDLAHWLGANG